MMFRQSRNSWSSGVAVKNVVLCFDQVRDPSDARATTNTTRLFGLLDQSADQLCWYRGQSLTRRHRVSPRGDERNALAVAYAFLRQHWAAGDRVFLFGSGPGGYCAQALVRLLNTVGVLPKDLDDLVEFCIGAYASPRTVRSGAEWQTVRDVVGGLVGGQSRVTPAYLGLWDATRPVSMPASAAEPLVVTSGRHALAADGAPSWHRPAPVESVSVQQAWFRGGRCDVAGGPGACEGLRRIAFDWILDGAVTAGLRLHCGANQDVPQHADALAGSARGLSLRTVPSGADVHASVEVHLQAHPEYWRRLPDHVVWTDRDWLSRGERLMARREAAPVALPQAEMASTTS
jgi:uncharacterized protein (DUF2235 family)